MFADVRMGSFDLIGGKNVGIVVVGKFAVCTPITPFLSGIIATQGDVYLYIFRLLWRSRQFHPLQNAQSGQIRRRIFGSAHQSGGMGTLGRRPPKVRRLPTTSHSGVY